MFFAIKTNQLLNEGQFICFNAQWDIGTKMVKEWKKWQTCYKYAYNKNLQNVKKREKILTT